MSQVNHSTTVRPGDRWDGVALTVHKTSFDWSQAQVTVQLRMSLRGPLVDTIDFSQSTATDTLVLGFYLAAVDTIKLRLGATYYGTVTVQIPNANPALEPTFGPYTLFTWAMEMTDRAQSASATYSVEFGSATTFNISLNEGSTITISGGGDGGGGGAPSAHSATHRNGGSDEVATGTPGANAIPKADSNGKLDAWVSSGAAAGTASLRSLGTGALQGCAGNDARLSDSRTPVAHTHPSGEITDFAEAVDDRVGALLVAGANITLTYNDAGNTLTIAGASGVTDGDKGDITIASGVWTIDASAVTYAKIQNVSATGKILGRSTAGAGVIEEIDCTAAGRAILDDADAAAQRATLGLVIGTNVQAFDAELAALAGLASAADKGIQFTGPGAAATYDLTTAGKALLDDADASAQRTTLGLGTLATQSGTFSGTSSGTNTGDQNLFQTISVSGQSDVVADSASDTLTLVAGSNITITTNAGTDSITIAATVGGGSVATDAIWDAVGDLAVGNGANSAAKLSAPSYYGSKLMWVFDAVEWVSHRTHFHVVDDFVGSEAAANYGLYGWERYTSGGSLTHVASDSNRPGIVSIETGTGTSGYFNLTWRANAQLLLGGGRIWAEWIVKLVTLSDGTNTYTAQIGIHDQAGAGVVDGCYFEYSHGVNGGQWQIKTTSNTTTTTTNTATAADTNFHVFAVDINAAASSVTFYIDGVSVGTHSANIPTGAGRETVPSCAIVKSAGTTSRLIYVDCFHLIQKFTTPR